MLQIFLDAQRWFGIFYLDINIHIREILKALQKLSSLISRLLLEMYFVFFYFSFHLVAKETIGNDDAENIPLPKSLSFKSL